MKQKEVDEETFRDLWKSRKTRIGGKHQPNELVKIEHQDQWLLCEIKEENEIRILLAKYSPY